MTLERCLKEATDKLNKCNINDSSYDALELLMYVTGINRTEYFFHQNDIIDDEKLDKYHKLIDKRAKREPLQHIIGIQNFYGYDFHVSPDVLIPRQDTEVLIELVLKKINEEFGFVRSDIDSESYKLNILDMCTGSGCIGVTLYKELEKTDVKCDITATDISDKAIDIASLNANELIGDSDRFHTVRSDLFANIDNNKKYDIIVSNPPYIPTKDIDDLEDEVRKHDPLIALDGGANGLDIYHRLIGESVKYIKNSGWLYMEMGYNQGEDITDIMKNNGYKDIRIFKDLAGLNRVICGSFS